MAKLSIVKASTDVTVYVFIQNSSLTTGAGLTGLVFNSASLVCYYVRPLAAAAVLTLVTQTVTGAHSDGGFVEVDATNMPGVYRLDLSDAICATGVNSVVVMLKGATNMAPVLLEIQLTSVNLNDSVRGGMTALPNAAADAAGGLPISDAGGLDLDARLDAAVTSRLAPTVAGRTLDVSTGGEAGIDWANIGSPTTAQNLSATNIDVDQVVASVSGAVGSVTAGVTLAASAVQAIWDALTSALTTVGSIGKLLVDNLNATISSRASQASVDTVDDFLDTEISAIKAKTDQLTFTTANKVDATIQAAGDFAQAAADKVWSTAARTLTAFGFSVTVGTNSDKTGYALSAAGVQAIWDALTSALTTVGSIGKLLVDNINATISSRSSQASVDTIDDFVDDLETRLTATRAGYLDNLSAGAVALQTSVDDLEGRLTATRAGYLDNLSAGAVALQSSVDSLETGVIVTTNNDKTGYRLSATGVDDIFDELRSGHSIAGSYGESFFTLVSGAAVVGTLSTTEMTTDLTEATNDHYNGRIIIWLTGVLVGQATDITDYDGATKKLTYTAITEAPAIGDRFIIV